MDSMVGFSDVLANLLHTLPSVVVRSLYFSRVENGTSNFREVCH